MILHDYKDAKIIAEERKVHCMCSRLAALTLFLSCCYFIVVVLFTL